VTIDNGWDDLVYSNGFADGGEIPLCGLRTFSGFTRQVIRSFHDRIRKRRMEQGTPDRELLTVEQAAQYLQISQSSIRSYIRQGMLKAFRIAGKRKVLIPRAELLALLEPARNNGLQPGKDGVGEDGSGEPSAE
jgi:excisionase family DNA binding protein